MNRLWRMIDSFCQNNKQVAFGVCRGWERFEVCKGDSFPFAFRPHSFRSPLPAPPKPSIWWMRLDFRSPGEGRDCFAVYFLTDYTKCLDFTRDSDWHGNKHVQKTGILLNRFSKHNATYDISHVKFCVATVKQQSTLLNMYSAIFFFQNVSKNRTRTFTIVFSYHVVCVVYRADFWSCSY